MVKIGIICGSYNEFMRCRDGKSKKIKEEGNEYIFLNSYKKIRDNKDIFFIEKYGKWKDQDYHHIEQEYEFIRFFNKYNKGRLIRYLISIDPGDNGCIVIYDLKIKKIIKKSKTPVYTLEYIELLDYYLNPKNGFEKSLILIEKVHSQPGNSHKSAFGFGYVVGYLHSVLDYYQYYKESCAWTFVSPQEWIKFYGMKKDKEESDNKWKNRLYELAKKVFYESTFYLYEADAFLINKYFLSNLNKWKI